MFMLSVVSGVCLRGDTVEADIVVGVPDSSLSAAMGYAERVVPYEMGLIKNKYVGRTFIRPTQGQREQGVRMKLSVVEHAVCRKRIVLVDDSIVRGTTSRRIVRQLREAGAREVHLRIASAPLISPCFYGVDFHSKDQLIAASHTAEEITFELGVDSLAFLDINDLKRAFGDKICLGCFEGNYPTDLYSWAGELKD